MTSVGNPRTFRDLLTEIMGKQTIGLSEDGIRKIEACLPTWRDFPPTTARLAVTTLFVADVVEREVAELTAHLPVPTWATRKPNIFGRYEDGTIRRYHYVESTDVPATNVGSDGSIGVTLTGTEFVGHPSVFSVLVVTDDGEYLSANQSRALAAVLLDAADKADALDLAQ